MIINIAKISRQVSVKGPDLITRPVGRSVYEKITEKIMSVGNSETVILDFEGFKVLDSSFIDEAIVKLQLDAINGSKNIYIKISNISKMAELNIESVINSYESFKQKKIVVLTEDICSNNKFYIGNLTVEEENIINLLRINKICSVNDFESVTQLYGDELAELIKGIIFLRLIKQVEKNKYSSV